MQKINKRNYCKVQQLNFWASKLRPPLQAHPIKELGTHSFHSSHTCPTTDGQIKCVMCIQGNAGPPQKKVMDFWHMQPRWMSLEDVILKWHRSTSTLWMYLYKVPTVIKFIENISRKGRGSKNMEWVKNCHLGRRKSWNNE